jgi:hypothetical protein
MCIHSFEASGKCNGLGLSVLPSREHGPFQHNHERGERQKFTPDRLCLHTADIIRGIQQLRARLGGELF